MNTEIHTLAAVLDQFNQPLVGVITAAKSGETVPLFVYKTTDGTPTNVINRKISRSKENIEALREITESATPYFHNGIMFFQLESNDGNS